MPRSIFYVVVFFIASNAALADHPEECDCTTTFGLTIDKDSAYDLPDSDSDVYTEHKQPTLPNFFDTTTKDEGPRFNTGILRNEEVDDFFSSVDGAEMNVDIPVE